MSWKVTARRLLRGGNWLPGARNLESHANGRHPNGDGLALREAPFRGFDERALSSQERADLAESERLLKKYNLKTLHVKLRDITQGEPSYPEFVKLYETNGIVLDGDKPTTLFGSLQPDGNFIPVFDLDVDCDLVPSSTPGHFHLYINKPIPFDAYKRILAAMRNAGLVEGGWLRNVYRDTGGLLRPPHVHKESYYQERLERLNALDQVK